MLYHTLESINPKFPSHPAASLPNLLKGKENTFPLESRKVVMLSISEQTKGTETNPDRCFQFFPGFGVGLEFREGKGNFACG